jgi:hypothetical protein
MESSIIWEVDRLYSPLSPLLIPTNTLLWTGARVTIEDVVDIAASWSVSLVMFHGLQDRDHPKLDKFVDSLEPR